MPDFSIATADQADAGQPLEIASKSMFIKILLLSPYSSIFWPDLTDIPLRKLLKTGNLMEARKKN